jgi:hypothetical protein
MPMHGRIIFKEKRDVTSLFELNEGNNNLSFRYQAISLENSNSIQYRYRLLGLDTTWKYTSDRETVFSDLKAGNYQFIVQAKENNQEWMVNQAAIYFVIRPYFWKTTWFILIVVLGVCCFSYFFIKRKVRKKMSNYLIEILRQLTKRVQRDRKMVTIQCDGKNIVINTDDIGFVKASGNYIEIFTIKRTYLTRLRIGDFLNLVEDPLEFIQLHRSYIIRKDKIEEKSNKEVVVFGYQLPVSRNRIKKLETVLIESIV